jgi:SEC-C motif-containing protein
MRSRYSAYVLGNEAYLLATWHAATRPVSLELDRDGKTRWLGLDVRHHAASDATTATVEFVARYKVGGRASRMHEISRFVREGDRWYYVDGDQHNSAAGA